jgi:hypothetical protein
MTSFETVWGYFQVNLKPGTDVKNWTAFKGYLGDSMTFGGIRGNFIGVEAPKAENILSVPREDFEKVWDVWSEYKVQKVRRYELLDMTRYSKYIISILH